MVEKTKTPAGIPDLSQTEVKAAKKEGATDYIKDGVAAAMSADTGTTGDADLSAERTKFQVAPDINSTDIAPLLNLSVDDLTKRLKSKAVEDAIDFEVAKGLLALERSGKNRTGYVKALCSAIGVKSPYEVTIAGPAYTNDETAVTEL